MFVAQLRTKQPAAKWVLAGVAIILDIGICLSRMFHVSMPQVFEAFHVSFGND